MPEVFGIIGAEEGTLVMIEPPGQILVRGIFEINDGIHIPVKKRVFKQLIGPMSQTGVLKIRARIEFALQEASDKGR